MTVRLALVALALMLTAGCHRRPHRAEAAEESEEMAVRKRDAGVLPRPLDAGVPRSRRDGGVPRDAGVMKLLDGGVKSKNLPDAGVPPRRDAGVRPPSDGPSRNLPDAGTRRPRPPRPIPRAPFAPL